jgi:iron complex transport system permease protein
MKAPESMRMPDQPALPWPVVFAAAGISVFVVIAVAVTFGAKSLTTSQLWHAMMSYDSSSVADVVVIKMRLPRIAAGILVGASLAVAGVVMQAMTQNPLASPSLMGLNAGGSLLLVLGVAFVPGLTLTGAIMLSFVGAGVGAGLVYLLAAASPKANTPVHMALAGMIVSILLGAVTQGLVQQLELAADMLFWAVGGLSNTWWSQVVLLIPPISIAMVGALILAPQWTVLSLGNDSAIGLGVNVRWIYLAGSVIVLLLAGSAIAAAGPVMFVGLMVPHICRFLVGTDCRKVIPLAMVLGALLVVLADTICRGMTQGRLPLGAITGALGGIVFVMLARRGGRLGDPT